MKVIVRHECWHRAPIRENFRYGATPSFPCVWSAPDTLISYRRNQQYGVRARAILHYELDQSEAQKKNPTTCILHVGDCKR